MKTCIHICNKDAFEPQKLVEVLPSYEVLYVKKNRFGNLHQVLPADGSILSNSRRLSCEQVIRGIYRERSEPCMMLKNKLTYLVLFGPQVDHR